MWLYYCYVLWMTAVEDVGWECKFSTGGLAEAVECYSLLAGGGGGTCGGWRLAAAKLWLGLDFRFGGKKFKIEIDSSIWPRFGGFKLNSTPRFGGKKVATPPPPPTTTTQTKTHKPIDNWMQPILILISI